ncbi:unnamed protein product [Ectocarpus sp. 8 AP-2014]
MLCPLWGRVALECFMPYTQLAVEISSPIRACRRGFRAWRLPRLDARKSTRRENNPRPQRRPARCTVRSAATCYSWRVQAFFYSIWLMSILPSPSSAPMTNPHPRSRLKVCEPTTYLEGQTQLCRRNSKTVVAPLVQRTETLITAM